MDGSTHPFAPLRGDDPARASTAGRVRTVVALAEVDRFLTLRGRLGYARSNRLMALVGERVRAAAPGITVGRVGRSAIELVVSAGPQLDLDATLHAIWEAARRPITLDGLDLTLTLTIGAVDLGDGAITDAAVDLAASTLAEAQRAHQRVRVIDAADALSPVSNDLELLRDFPEAMRTGALQVHYQPKLRVRSNRIDAAEGLIRWRHPVSGPVAIEPFVRLLEETGGIRRLTEWVIARAVLDSALLAESGHDLTLWVNLSGPLLADDAFIARALELVAGSDCRIGFEITETAVIGDPERALANLAVVTAAGVKIAIDDYGSGLSSLAYLKQLPAQELKIDRLFIKELVDSHRDPLLVRSSIDLAHALDMEVTAEGVDDPMALALLTTMGCDLVQGYILSPALPLAELRHLLDDHARVDDLTAPRGRDAWIGAATRRIAGQG